MSRLALATIVPSTVTAALAAFAAALADPVCDGLQALAQHRLIAAGSVLLAVASAVTLGIAIGRGRSGDAGASMAATAMLSPVGPIAAQVQAEAMTRAETEFLANMSHELRTPLNAVIGFAELILSEVHGPLGDRRYLEYINHIRAGGEQLLAIVGATLDLSQLAAGQLDLQLCRVEPRVIVEECAQSVAAQAEAAKVELVVRPSIAAAVAADPARLKQALTNLLSNAIKFTAQGGRVSIGATAHDDDVAFEVTDTGIGMTPGQIAVAMQSFRMVDGSLTRRHSGIGLGLPLAERLLRLHGGELRIDSQPGCGTAVTAILPARNSRQPGKR
jgi:two-component system cell cycle sensor histidine kinase PleC